MIPSYLIQPSDKVISYFAKPSYHNSINAMHLLVELIVILLLFVHFYINVSIFITPSGSNQSLLHQAAVNQQQQTRLMPAAVV